MTTIGPLHYIILDMTRTDKVLVVHSERVFVGRELHPQRSDDGLSCLLGISKQCVPVWEQSVSLADSLADDLHVLLGQDPRFSTAGV